MNDFTKEELYEIEKLFDMYAGSSGDGMARFVSSLDKWAHKMPQLEAHMSKVFDEHIHAWNAYRTISAKAKRMRDYGQKEKEDVLTTKE